MIFGMGLTSGGKIVVSGFTTLPNFSYDIIMLQYDSTGARDASFGTNGLVQFDNDVQDVAYDLEIQPDGKILLAGTSGGFFFDPRDYILMRYNADGTADTTFDSDGWLLTDIMTQFDEANEMALQADGKILLAGKANNSSNNDACVVRYHNQLSSSVQELGVSAAAVYPSPAAAGSSITLVTEFKNAGDMDIRMSDISGRVVETGKVWMSDGKATFILPGEIAPGVYFISLDAATVKITVR